jgi:hypothetical protein
MTELKVIKVAGSYVLKVLSAGWNSWYEIDGVKFKDAQDVVFQEPPEYSWKFTTNSRLHNYKRDDGQLLSIESYKEKIGELTKDCACSGEPIFDSLEQEYEYKKFVQSCQPVYVEDITKEPVKLDFQEYGESRNKYIVSMRFVGQDISNCLFQYIPNAVLMAQEVAREYGFEQIEDNTWNDKTKGFKFSIPTHSGIRYMKVNAQYVCDDTFRLSSVSAGTLSECEEAYKKDRAKLESLFSKQKSLIETRDFDAQAFYADILTLEGKIRSIDYRRNAVMNYRGALNFAEAIKEKLLSKTKESV